MEDIRWAKGKIWTSEVIENQDDIILKKQITVYGLKNWKVISQDLLNNFGIKRTPKQCRDRWCNYLKIEEFSPIFTENEKNMIFKNFFEIGSKWSVLSEIIKTKSENQIKNFINSTVRRNIRKFNKGKNFEDRINFSSIDILSITELKEILIADKDASIEYLSSKCLNEESKQKIEKMRIENSNKSLESNFLIGELDNILEELLNLDSSQLIIIT